MQRATITQVATDKSEDKVTTFIINGGTTITGFELVPEKLIGVINVILMGDHAKENYGVQSVNFKNDSSPKGKLGMAYPDNGAIAINLEEIWNYCVDCMKDEKVNNLSILGLIWFHTLKTVLHEIHHIDGCRDADYRIKAENRATKETFEEEAEKWAEEKVINLAKEFDIEAPDLASMPFYGLKMMELMTGKLSDKEWVLNSTRMIEESIIYEDKANDVKVSSFREYLRAAYDPKEEDAAWEKGTTVINLEFGEANSENEKYIIGQDEPQTGKELVAIGEVKDETVISPTKEAEKAFAEEIDSIEDDTKEVKTEPDTDMEAAIEMAFNLSEAEKQPKPTSQADLFAETLAMGPNGLAPTKFPTPDPIITGEAGTVAESEGEGWIEDMDADDAGMAEGIPVITKTDEKVQEAVAQAKFMVMTDQVPATTDKENTLPFVPLSDEAVAKMQAETAAGRSIPDTVTLPDNIVAENAQLAKGVLPMTEMVPATTYLPNNLSPDTIKAFLSAVYMRLYTVIFTKCGRIQNSDQGFTNPGAVLEHVDIRDLIELHQADNLIMSYDTLNVNGSYAREEFQGSIRGTVFRKKNPYGLPAFAMYLNIGGQRVERRLVAQNPGKMNASGQLSTTALEARQGHAIAWIMGDGLSTFIKIRDNVYNA